MSKIDIALPLKRDYLLIVEIHQKSASCIIANSVKETRYGEKE